LALSGVPELRAWSSREPIALPSFGGGVGAEMPRDGWNQRALHRPSKTCAGFVLGARLPTDIRTPRQQTSMPALKRTDRHTRTHYRHGY
jgi:hypothetical protein